MLNFIINLLLFMLSFPFEIMFIGYVLIKIKDIKSKKMFVYLIVGFAYILGGIITNFNYEKQYLFYLIFTFLSYILLKVKYKKHFEIYDIFTIFYIGEIIFIASLISMCILGYNLIAMLLSRLFLFLIMLICSKLSVNKFYKRIYINWNKGHKIKSITLRNIFIIAFNILLFITNYMIMNYLLQIYSNLFLG